MVFLNRSFDKKRLKALLLWFRLNLSEGAALEAVEILQELGFRSATQGAISLGLDDLKTPTSKNGRVFQAQLEVALAHHEHHRGNRTPVELFQHLVDTWHRTSQDLTTEVVQLFRSTERVNPVYMMAFSGARGNLSQVRQLVGMRGLMADPRGQIVGFPILSNFREGLTITEYFVSCYGARKGVVDTAIRTADAGYLTRRLADVSHHFVVRTTNCGTHRTICLRDIKEGQKTILPLASRLVGRVLGEHIPQIAFRNQEITPDLASKLASQCTSLQVRSPLSCSLRWGVCQLCYGWGLSEGRRVTLGEAVGIIAAQSIGEPGTQLTLRTFHTGGVFSGDLLNEIRAPYNGTVFFPSPLQGLLVRTPHGQIAFLTKVSGKMIFSFCRLPSNAPPMSFAEGNLAQCTEGSNCDCIENASRQGKENAQSEVHVQDVNTKEDASPRLPKVNDADKMFASNADAMHAQPPETGASAKLFSDQVQKENKEFSLQPSTVIFVRQKEQVTANQLLAEFSSSTLQPISDQIEVTQQVLSESAGQVWFKEIEYGNRKGPGSGSLGTHFSSQKLGGVWVLAGKPRSEIILNDRQHFPVNSTNLANFRSALLPSMLSNLATPITQNHLQQNSSDFTPPASLVNSSYNIKDVNERSEKRCGAPLHQRFCISDAEHSGVHNVYHDYHFLKYQYSLGYLQLLTFLFAEKREITFFSLNSLNSNSVNSVCNRPLRECLKDYSTKKGANQQSTKISIVAFSNASSQPCHVKQKIEGGWRPRGESRFCISDAEHSGVPSFFTSDCASALGESSFANTVYGWKTYKYCYHPTSAIFITSGLCNFDRADDQPLYASVYISPALKIQNLFLNKWQKKGVDKFSLLIDYQRRATHISKSTIISSELDATLGSCISSAPPTVYNQPFKTNAINHSRFLQTKESTVIGPEKKADIAEGTCGALAWCLQKEQTAAPGMLLAEPFFSSKEYSEGQVFWLSSSFIQQKKLTFTGNRIHSVNTKEGASTMHKAHAPKVQLCSGAAWECKGEEADYIYDVTNTSLTGLYKKGPIIVDTESLPSEETSFVSLGYISSAPKVSATRADSMSATRADSILHLRCKATRVCASNFRFEKRNVVHQRCNPVLKKLIQTLNLTRRQYSATNRGIFSPLKQNSTFGSFTALLNYEHIINGTGFLQVNETDSTSLGELAKRKSELDSYDSLTFNLFWQPLSLANYPNKIVCPIEDWKEISESNSIAPTRFTNRSLHQRYNKGAENVPVGKSELRFVTNLQRQGQKFGVFVQKPIWLSIHISNNTFFAPPVHVNLSHFFSSNIKDTNKKSRQIEKKLEIIGKRKRVEKNDSSLDQHIVHTINLPIVDFPYLIPLADHKRTPVNINSKGVWVRASSQLLRCKEGANIASEAGLHLRLCISDAEHKSIRWTPTLRYILSVPPKKPFNYRASSLCAPKVQRVSKILSRCTQPLGKPIAVECIETANLRFANANPLKLESTDKKLFGVHLYTFAPKVHRVQSCIVQKISPSKNVTILSKKQVKSPGKTYYHSKCGTPIQGELLPLIRQSFWEEKFFDKSFPLDSAVSYTKGSGHICIGDRDRLYIKDVKKWIKNVARQKLPFSIRAPKVQRMNSTGNIFKEKYLRISDIQFAVSLPLKIIINFQGRYTSAHLTLPEKNLVSFAPLTNKPKIHNTLCAHTSSQQSGPGCKAQRCTQAKQTPQVQVQSFATAKLQRSCEAKFLGLRLSPPKFARTEEFAFLGDAPIGANKSTGNLVYTAGVSPMFAYAPLGSEFAPSVSTTLGSASLASHQPFVGSECDCSRRQMHVHGISHTCCYRLMQRIVEYPAERSIFNRWVTTRRRKLQYSSFSTSLSALNSLNECNLFTKAMHGLDTEGANSICELKKSSALTSKQQVDLLAFSRAEKMQFDSKRDDNNALPIRNKVWIVEKKFTSFDSATFLDWYAFPLRSWKAPLIYKDASDMIASEAGLHLRRSEGTFAPLHRRCIVFGCISSAPKVHRALCNVKDADSMQNVADQFSANVRRDFGFFISSSTQLLQKSTRFSNILINIGDAHICFYPCTQISAKNKQKRTGSVMFDGVLGVVPSEKEKTGGAPLVKVVESNITTTLPFSDQIPLKKRRSVEVPFLSESDQITFITNDEILISNSKKHTTRISIWQNRSAIFGRLPWVVRSPLHDAPSLPLRDASSYNIKDVTQSQSHFLRRFGASWRSEFKKSNLYSPIALGIYTRAPLCFESSVQGVGSALSEKKVNFFTTFSSWKTKTKITNAKVYQAIQSFFLPIKVAFSVRAEEMHTIDQGNKKEASSLSLRDSSSYNIKDVTQSQAKLYTEGVKPASQIGAYDSMHKHMQHNARCTMHNAPLVQRCKGSDCIKELTSEAGGVKSEVQRCNLIASLSRGITSGNCRLETTVTPTYTYLYPGQLVTYGEKMDQKVATTESGQVLYLDSQRATLRKAQTVLIYSQAILSVLSGEWIKKSTPLMALSYQKLVTGDIVQGLPKIEQFFEAPLLKDGTFWSDSLQAKLNLFFQEHRGKFPLAEAVRKGFSDIQRVLVEGVQRVYISQGVLIADKHLEVIVRQMTCKGRILYSGDTGFLRNELVALDKIESVNQVTYGQKALYHPQVRGITDASLESESFLSAASFQETTRVLSRDAVIGKTDLMRGLKERVIVGELIQAGTGLTNNSVYSFLLD